MLCLGAQLIPLRNNICRRSRSAVVRDDEPNDYPPDSSVIDGPASGVARSCRNRSAENRQAHFAIRVGVAAPSHRRRHRRPCRVRWRVGWIRPPMRRLARLMLDVVQRAGQRIASPICDCPHSTSSVLITTTCCSGWRTRPGSTVTRCDRRMSFAPAWLRPRTRLRSSISIVRRHAGCWTDDRRSRWMRAFSRQWPGTGTISGWT